MADRATRRVRGAALPGPVGLVLAVALALAGCGADTADPGTSSGAGSGTGANAFPLTLSRSGGIAGFQDVLSVAADGRVTGTTKAGAVDCTTSEAVATTLAARLDGATGTPRAGSDQISVTLTGGGRQVSLGEGSGADPAAKAANDLLNAVQLSPAPGSPCHAG